MTLFPSITKKRYDLEYWACSNGSYCPLIYTEHLEKHGPPNICLSKQVSFTLFYMEQIDHLEHFDHQECPFKGHFWQKGAF